MSNQKQEISKQPKGVLLFEETLADPHSFYICGGNTVSLYEKGDGPECWSGDHHIPRLIQTDQAFNLHFKWCAYGCLVNAIAGNWKLSVLFEKMGPQEGGLHDPNAGEKTVKFEPCDGYCYDEYICIPANCMDPGVYDITVCIVLCDVKGRPLPVAAFGELGKFHFYVA